MTAAESQLAEPLTESYWPVDNSDSVEETTVGQALRDAAQDSPDTVAIVAGAPQLEDRLRWTYAELLGHAERAAHALLARFDPGERVAVWANNISEWIVLEYGAALAGLTVVTVNPALRAAELAHVLGRSRAQGIFLVSEYRGSSMSDTLSEVRPHLPDLREVVDFADWEDFCRTESDATLPSVQPGDPVQIQYTSGTTGSPKGAVLNHRGVVNNARMYARRFGLDPGHVMLSPMPLFHTAGCVMSVLGTLARRGTLVLPPAFDPESCLELIESERVDSLMGVPTMLIGLLEHPRFAETDRSRVRRVLSGGAMVPPTLVRRVEKEFGAVCAIVFAQTEASPAITQTAPDDDAVDRAETLGRPLPCIEVKIADPQSKAPVALDEIGEICTRGYHVMTGYFDEPEMTAAAIDDEGWLHTGDLGSMDARGFCRIEGRLKDMIIRGGENIYSREVEQVLSAHPTVADVAVVGIADETWGEQVAAFIRPEAGTRPDENQLFAYCRELLAPHKTPVHWEFLDEFPLTASGKVQKHLLRERLEQRLRPSSAAASESSELERRQTLR